MDCNGIAAQRTRRFRRGLWLITSTIPLFAAVQACTTARPLPSGFTYVMARGTPPVQSIAWSPVDENLLLTLADNPVPGPAEVSLYNIESTELRAIAATESGTFRHAAWAADGETARVLAGDNTVGFRPSGWWEAEVATPSWTYLLEEGFLAWSPDDTTTAAIRASRVGSSYADLEVVLTSLASGEVRTIPIGGDFDTNYGLSWAPDGGRLVFSAGISPSAGLYVMDVATGQIVGLRGAGPSKYPVWSPHSDLIAFVRTPHLFLTPPDGGCEIQVPYIEDAWTSVTWSPDGRRLAYVGTQGVYIVDVFKVLGEDTLAKMCG